MANGVDVRFFEFGFELLQIYQNLGFYRLILYDSACGAFSWVFDDALRPGGLDKYARTAAEEQGEY